jgi:hypothetical protein
MKGVVMMPLEGSMQEMTMEEFRSSIGNECTIDNCEECLEHARERGIQIKEG